jgi:hypothetical protein
MTNINLAAMAKSKRQTTQRTARDWVAHLGMTMRRRGGGYSIWVTHCDGRDRHDFRSLSKVEAFLNDWMECELQRLEDER